MRFRIATIFALAASALAGCGGDDSSPFDPPLSYLPRDAVFAAAIETDLDGDQYRALDDLLNEFAFSGEVRERLREQLAQASDGRFEEDVRPLLGNPAVLGIPQASGEETEPVLAMQTADEDKLNELVERQNARELGEAAGATLYEDENNFFAVEGGGVVFASDRRRLTA